MPLSINLFLQFQTRVGNRIVSIPQALEQPNDKLAIDQSFIDRRRSSATSSTPARERRQFTNSHSELSVEAAELAQAIDAYKAQHRRRFINYEEVLAVVQSLGYSRG